MSVRSKQETCFKRVSEHVTGLCIVDFLEVTYNEEGICNVIVRKNIEENKRNVLYLL